MCLFGKADLSTPPSAVVSLGSLISFRAVPVKGVSMVRMVRSSQEPLPLPGVNWRHTPPRDLGARLVACMAAGASEIGRALVQLAAPVEKA